MLRKTRLDSLIHLPHTRFLTEKLKMDFSFIGPEMKNNREVRLAVQPSICLVLNDGADHLELVLRLR